VGGVHAGTAWAGGEGWQVGVGGVAGVAVDRCVVILLILVILVILLILLILVILSLDRVGCDWWVGGWCVDGTSLALTLALTLTLAYSGCSLYGGRCAALTG
jgi:hypothetical protein